MLSFLKITNLAILDDVSLEPGPGLNVLTGETGAGKSIVVDAIGLVLGERGQSDMIRSGSDRLVVEALFDLAGRADAAAICAAAGLAAEGAPADQLVIRREIIGLGGAVRSRAMINGHLVTLADLKRLGESLADLHGQHQHQSLLGAEGQRQALDVFASALGQRDLVASLSAAISSLERDIEDLSGRERERARLEDNLRRQIAEIEATAPRAGEEDDLAREESLLRHASEVSRLAGEAFRLLSDDDDSVIARLGTVADRLGRLADIDPDLEATRRVLDEARVASAEAARALARYVDAEDADPGRLDQVGARLADLDRLKRKYGATIEEVISYLDRSRLDLEALAGASDRLERLAGDLEEARERYREAARDLSARRVRAARRLEKAIEKELSALAMEGTRVEITVEPIEGERFGAHGADAIAFLIAPNRGENLKPLARIASGGELSRLMLAARNAAGARSDHRTLIFDEVDSGIGGGVAEVVGQRLSALAAGQQVFCVTHLPQIAAFADRHFEVTKSDHGGRTSASVRLLEGHARVDELARMLGGSPPGTARRHAAALVRTAGRRGRVST